jgi:sugar lactone lactonase YvrE
MSHRFTTRVPRPAAAGALLLVLAACGAPDTDTARTPAKRAPLPDRAARATGFQHPESVRYDSAADVFYVSNIVGDPFAKDGNGFISRMRPDGTIDSLHFIASGRNGVTLNAPKGLALVADTLWVADLDAVRAFDVRTGAPVATVDLSSQHALFLNDIAVAPDGSLYITDTGWRMENGKQTHPAGTDRIFRIAPDRSVSVALATDALDRPNGITWDARHKRFVVVPIGGSSAIFSWAPGDTAPRIIGHNSASMDGVELLPDGRMVVTSWKDSTVTIRSGDVLTAVRGMPSPADIGVDTRRNHVAVPLLLEDRVEIWSVPPAQP